MRGGRPEPVAALAHVLPPVVAFVPPHRARLRVILAAARCPVPVRRTRQNPGPLGRTRIKLVVFVARTALAAVAGLPAVTVAALALTSLAIPVVVVLAGGGDLLLALLRPSPARAAEDPERPTGRPAPPITDAGRPVAPAALRGGRGRGVPSSCGP